MPSPRFLPAACALAALAWNSSTPAATTPVAAGASYTVELTSSLHAVNHPYFGPSHDRWGEGLSRLRVSYGAQSGAWLTVGGVAMGTAGTDDYGTRDVGDGRLDQLVAGCSNLAGGRLAIAAGRQDLTLGDGFLISDGYRDTKAALWNIPLSYFDAVKAEYHQGPAHALAFAANLSPSFAADSGLTTKGQLAGLEAGWQPAAGSDIALTGLLRNDTGTTDLDASALSLRGSFARGPLRLNGEAVLEGGRRAGVTLAGHGGHVAMTLAHAVRWKPEYGVEYFLFSGDDPATAKDEGYYPWMFGWKDWSQYYVGDLLSSTVGTSTNMRILELHAAVTPREGTSVKLLVHRMDLDQPPPGAEADESKDLAYESDLVVDQELGEHWSAWLMGAYATPRYQVKDAFGSDASSQVFGSVTFKFGGPGGE